MAVLVLRKAGREAIHFHDPRHTNATLLLEQGVRPQVVQERLGHSDIGVTPDIYSRVMPTLGRDAPASSSARPTGRAAREKEETEDRSLEDGRRGRRG